MVQEATTAGRGDSRIVDERDMRARDVEFVRTLEANGFTLLAAAVARRLLRPPDEVPEQAAEQGVTVDGRECQIIVMGEERLVPEQRGGHGAGGTVATILG